MKDVDLAAMVEALKESLTAVATGGTASIDDLAFRRTRQALLQHPNLVGLVPEWLSTQRTHWEAVRELNDLVSRAEGGDMPGHYKRRRARIAGDLNPLINELEAIGTRSSLSLEFGERLGGGGFGEVFRARHRLVGVEFAVKVLHPAFASAQDHAIERFFREARILFRLNHRSIVRVFDVGMTGRRPFIQMELVDGQTLLKRIQASSMTATDARALVRQVASALRHAHAEGVVHRDLKPSNVMISARDGRAVVLDFGMGAFVTDEIASRITRTGEGVAGGLYTAPDLIAAPRLLDPRTDIYSLGALWYELLVGRPPGGTQVEAPLRAITDLRGRDRDLLVRCLGPIDARPAASEVEDEFVSSTR